MRAARLLAGLALVSGSSGCVGGTAPERVADQFAEAYFRRADPLAARQFAALGAGEMLDREIGLARSVRGGAVAETAPGVAVRREGRAVRGERVRVSYEIAFRDEGGESKRSADLELARVDAVWKVVRVDVKRR
jgi:hypothetical protein